MEQSFPLMSLWPNFTWRRQISTPLHTRALAQLKLKQPTWPKAFGPLDLQWCSSPRSKNEVATYMVILAPNSGISSWHRNFHEMQTQLLGLSPRLHICFLILAIGWKLVSFMMLKVGGGKIFSFLPLLSLSIALFLTSPLLASLIKA